MTYDELDQKIVDRAVQECLRNPSGPALALMIAKLAREQGPVLITEPEPKPVDPDLAEAEIERLRAHIKITQTQLIILRMQINSGYDFNENLASIDVLLNDTRAALQPKENNQ